MTRPAGPDQAQSAVHDAGRRKFFAALALGSVLAIAQASGVARGADLVATYRAYWAGLPAGQIRLQISNAAASYRDQIEIRSDGLPQLFTHFRGTAAASGRIGAARAPDPARYDALYDLRKRRDVHIGLRFVARDGADVAERSADDSSRKPPLAEKYRRGIVDPLTALERIRSAILACHAAPNATFLVPVYDGARRFDVLGHILPKDPQTPGVLRVELNLRPIAGFKGESSEDGDPENAPRPVALSLTDDARLLPVSIAVRVFYLPLVVQLDRICSDVKSCSG